MSLEGANSGSTRVLCDSILIFSRWDFLLEIDPAILTCGQVHFNLANIDTSDLACIEQKDKYQEPCCGDEEPDPADFPTLPPFPQGPAGTEPDCPICTKLEFPGIPNAVISARYLQLILSRCFKRYDPFFHVWTFARLRRISLRLWSIQSNMHGRSEKVLGRW
jgi:hypothetical protein